MRRFSPGRILAAFRRGLRRLSPRRARTEPGRPRRGRSLWRRRTRAETGERRRRISLRRRRTRAGAGKPRRRLLPRRGPAPEGEPRRRLSPRRVAGGLRGRLADARYAIEDVLYLTATFLRRVPRALGRGARAFWWSLGVGARRRLVGALGAAVALVLFLGIAVPSLPCEVPGAGPCPPPDDTEELVPANALAYLQVSLDPETDQYSEATEVVAALPMITGQVLGEALGLVPGMRPRVDFDRDIAPWFAGQAALAELPDRGQRTDRVALLEVDDAEQAAAFAEDIASGRPGISEHEEIEVAVDAEGLAWAQLEGFLTIGPERAVHAVIDVATSAEGASSIADDAGASDVRDELPEDRLAQGYLSPEGADLFISQGDGPAASLAPFASAQATRGIGVSLNADDGELIVTMRSAIDPDRARVEPGFFAALEPFEPDLPERLPADSLAYAGFGDPERSVEELLAQATAQAPGVALGFEGLARELRRDGDIDIERQLLPALGDEAAFVIEPRPDAGPEGADPAPFLTAVARDVDEEGAREALARLQGPIVEAIEPALDLQAPVFRELEIDGVEARSLRISPAIELTYGVADGLAMIATDPLGIERLVDGDGALQDAELFRRATSDFPETVSLLAFLDLGRLILAAEQLGLGEDPAYGIIAHEIRALRALGLAVHFDGDLLSTDARLVVEAPADVEAPLEPVEPEESPELELPPDTPGFEPPPERPGFEPPPPPPELE